MWCVITVQVVCKIYLVCRSTTRLGLTGALRSFSRYSESSLLSPRPTVDVAAANLRWNNTHRWGMRQTFSKPSKLFWSYINSVLHYLPATLHYCILPLPLYLHIFLSWIIERSNCWTEQAQARYVKMVWARSPPQPSTAGRLSPLSFQYFQSVPSSMSRYNTLNQIILSSAYF